MNAAPLWLSISAYGRRYGLHRNTVTRWMLRDRLEIFREGPTVRVRNLPPDQHQTKSRDSPKVVVKPPLST